MKTNDLKNIYSNPPKEFHNSVIRSLNKLEDKAPVRYSKRRKTMKIAIACAIIATLGTFTTVASDEKTEVCLAIESLPIKIRQVVVLYYMESFTVKEIKGILKIPEGTVKSRLSKGRELLKLELS